MSIVVYVLAFIILHSGRVIFKTFHQCIRNRDIPLDVLLTFCYSIVHTYLKITSSSFVGTNPESTIPKFVHEICRLFRSVINGFLFKNQNIGVIFYIKPNQYQILKILQDS